ncbi:hypothetical protein DSECCO2_341440 [anaerobic digester metagenome]
MNHETFSNDLNNNVNNLNSWEGFLSNPTGQKLSLNILVNVIYDQTPEMDPYYNNPGGAWPEETVSGINNSDPLPEWLPDLFDTEYNENGITHGIFTRKFHEASLGNLYIIGDYVLINIRQSYITNGNSMDYHQFTVNDFVTKSIEFLQANDGGLETIFHQHDYSEYDLNNDGYFDFVTMLIRNTCTKTIQIGDESRMLVYGEINKGIGRGIPVFETLIFPDENSLQIPWMTIQCIGNETDMIENPVSAIYHEAGHFFIGFNNMHSGGGNGWEGNSGRVFLQLMGGYGIMGQSSTGLVSVNGFDRWWLHWKSPVYNSTNSYIAASNQPSDITQTDGTKNFILRDFVTTGDAIRIKLPYVDAGAKNQYIWLENHKIGINDKLDFLQYSSDECRPAGKPGIYAYYQVGKDILSGDNIRPSGESDHLRIISAEGNYDYSHLDNTMINCIANGPAERGKRDDPNSFMGTNDAMAQFYDKYPFPNTLTRDNAYGLFRKQLFVNGQLVETDSIPYLMDERDAFRGSRSFNLSTNPAPVNTTTFYNIVNSDGIISPNTSFGLVNNDSIYLTGLNIKMMPLTNGDYKVTVDWGHNRLDNSVAWTGKIALPGSLYVYDDDTLLLKQNNTPCSIFRDPFTQQFAPFTAFDCRSNSSLTLSNTSRMIASEQSKIYIQAGSVMTLQNSAKLIIKSGCELIIEDCGNLVIRDNAQLVIESGGIITIKSGANVFMDGLANLDLQIGFVVGVFGIPITMSNATALLGVPPVKQITTNTTWTGQTYRFFDDLYISPGATLNLSGTTLQFFRNAKVKVARSAKLNMTNESKLTASCASELWNGVEVWGDPSISQSPTTNQGFVAMNNSTIELARTGVLLDRPMPTDGPGVTTGHGGGILQAYNSTFRNNFIGVNILGYTFENISTFENCLFTANEQYPDLSVGIDCHTNLNGVTGIDFLKCTFSISDGVINNAGIRSHNSYFLVDGIISNRKYQRSVFESLKYGVYATGSLTNRIFIVRNSVFRSCNTGVFASGVNGSRITENLFLQPTFKDSKKFTEFGIFLEYCHNYIIQEDTLTGIDTHIRSEAGILIRNSGPAENLVYKNVLGNFIAGIISEGENRGPLGTGLCIKCNEFYFNMTDIQLLPWGGIPYTSQGIKRNQGSDDDIVTAPAGNWFTNPSNPDIININNALTQPIEYFYHTTPIDPRLKPNDDRVVVFGNTVFLSPGTGIPYVKEEACPSKLNKKQSKEELITSSMGAITEISETELQLTTLTDDGDTPVLVNTITSSAPFEALSLYDDLINASPYLSDTALVEAGKKEEVLNSALIRDIMVANPHAAKSPEVIAALEQRTEQLPEELLDEIKAGKEQISARQRLELIKSDRMADLAATRSELLQAYQEEHNIDSLRWALDQFPEPLSGYQKAWTYFDEGNTGNGLTALQNLDIETVPAHHRSNQPGYVMLAGILDHLATDSSYVLSEDTTAIVALLTLATNSNSAGASARDLLSAYRIITYEPSVTLPDTSLKSSFVVNKPKTKGKSSQAMLHVFPNPADNYIVIAYQLEKEGELSIVSQDGRIVHSQIINPGQNQVVIRVNYLTSGIYVARMVEGKKVRSTKFTVK